jgi:signal transduction histidine kinase
MVSTSIELAAHSASTVSERSGPGESEILRRLAACLAHHVNNALTGVIGHLEMGLLGVENPSPVRAHFQASLACAFQAAAAVRRIVTFTQRTPPPHARLRLSLAALAEQCLDYPRLKPLPSLTVGLAAESPGWVQAGEAMLRGALEGIIDNAIEAMPNGGVLQVRTWESEGQCRLSVQDNGPGISACVRERLFEPFVTTKYETHLGLGLVLAREMIRSQGGVLDVSTSGEGTIVTLSMPHEQQAQTRRLAVETIHDLAVTLPPQH